MKKIFLATALLFAIIATQAQIGISSEYKPKKPYMDNGGGIGFGIKAGANFADLGGDDAEGLDMLINFHGGALVHIPFGGMFAVQPEVLFSGEGAKADG